MLLYIYKIIQRGKHKKKNSEAHNKMMKASIDSELIKEDVSISNIMKEQSIDDVDFEQLYQNVKGEPTYALKKRDTYDYGNEGNLDIERYKRIRNILIRCDENNWKQYFNNFKQKKNY